MSLKENIDYVKEELSSEEKFLEGSVKAERFFKKYKVLIIAGVSLAVVAFATVSITGYLKEENKKEANIAFNQILKNPNDTTALSVLEDKNRKLHQIALYLQAKKENKVVNIDVKFLKELTEYKNVLKDQNIDKLNSISMQNDFLLKEFAIFNKALIQVENGKYEDAKATLRLIPTTSTVTDLVKILNHYLLTK